MEPDCLLLLGSTGLNELSAKSGEQRMSRRGCIVDFSEGGLQLQFQCEDVLRFLNGSMRFIEVHGTRVPVFLKWCKHSPQAGRGGVAFEKGSGGRYPFMNLVAGLGEDLVRFLLGGFRQGTLRFGEQGAVFAGFSLVYALRLQLLRAVASVIDLAEDAKNTGTGRNLMVEILGELKAMKSSFARDSQTDSNSDFLMQPFYNFGGALLGMHEDCVFLERDALAVIKSSILPIRQDDRTPVDIFQGLRFLHGSYLELQHLLPGIFQDERFDFQFGAYSKLLSKFDSLKDRMVDSLSPAGNHSVIPLGTISIPVKHSGHSVSSNFFPILAGSM
jgi:hypothetical protein